MKLRRAVRSAGAAGLIVLASLACSQPALTRPPAPDATPASSATDSPHLASGLEAYENERYDQAIDELTLAAAADPGQSYTFYLRGASYYNRYSDAYPNGDADDFYRAITDFTKAIELNHDYAEAYNFRALAFAGFDQTGHALDDYTMALQLDPELATAYYGRGLVFEQRGEAQNAIADYRRFLELSDDDYWRREAEKRLVELDAAP
jgi:tetratricopeptide (TPR) repeat protein